MGYTLEEQLESGERLALGDPFADLMVAKVIASKRAARTRKPVAVVDDRNGEVVARFEPHGAPARRSVDRLRAAVALAAASTAADLRRRSG